MNPIVKFITVLVIPDLAIDAYTRKYRAKIASREGFLSLSVPVPDIKDRL